MIAVTSNMSETVEVVVEGRITPKDREELDQQLKQERDKLNLLVAIYDLKDYSIREMIEDLKLGASHWKTLNKIAIISDETLIGLSAINKVIPKIELAEFDFGEREKALDWLNK